MSNLQFNETFYLSTYPDVAAAVSRGQIASGQAHYQSNGRFEGRNPNQFFNTSEYLGRYPDVARAGVNPLTHFLTSGAAEGRFANSNEDSAIDLNNNDVADDFNAAAYLAQYPDVAAQTGAGRPFATAYQHFVQFGQFEGRTATLSNGQTVTGPFANGGGTTPVTPGGTGSTTPTITGSTITLTNNLDGPGAASPAVNTNGTVNNDLYLADNNTLTTDAINGGAGTDTLRITNAAGAATTFAPSLTSVERVEVSTLGGAATTINLANSTGVQTIARTSGNNALTVAQAGNIVALEVNGITGGTTTLNYNPAVVAGATDVQKVTFGTTTSGAITANGAETFDVTTNGATTVASLVSNTLSSVKFSGTGALTVTNVLTGATTVDASAIAAGVGTAAAGSISVSLDTTKDVTVTGGAGNDVFNFTTGFTAADKVNGGAGTDAVRVSNAADVDLSAAAATTSFNGLTSIEKVAFDGAGGVILNGSTFTNTGITNIEFNTTGADVINNAGSARTYEFGASNNSGDASFNLNGTSTSLNLSLLGTVGATAVNGLANTVEVGALNVALAGTQPAGTLSTIAISSVGNFTATSLVNDGGNIVGLAADTFNSIGNVNSVSGSTVTLTGNAALDIASFTNNATVNASALTGSLAIQGSAIVLANVGAAGTATTTTQGFDTFTLGTARDVVQFNANGLDSGIIQFAAPAGGGAAVANGNVLVDTINSFTAGATGDVLDIAGVAATYTALAAASQTAIGNLSGATATLFAAADLAANGNAASGWTAFSFQGQTYALFENATNFADGFTNADTLVRLAGVNVTDLATANFA